MKPNQTSTTAENNALLRAYESMRPESERICDDPYATYFLPERFLLPQDKYHQIHRSIASWEALFPGVGNAIIARTRFIDDCLKDAIRAGIRQLVILGAGYDTRALRFGALKDAVTVFELDHPATQKVKLERIEKYLQLERSYIKYISIDFSKEALDGKLFANGYNKKLKTFFIWEGVTYYIPAAAIDRTLSFIAKNSAPESAVVFDYFPPSVASGTTRLAEARALREGLKHIGEEIVFGILPVNLREFMDTRGFRVLKNLSSTQFKDIYLKNICKNRRFSDMFVFVLAAVS